MTIPPFCKLYDATSPPPKPSDAVSHMSAAEQASMSRVIEQKQMKDFMKLYTNLVERCFESCCNDFTSKALTTKEVS
jgi:Tim10/DDP family zinc finger